MFRVALAGAGSPHQGNALRLVQPPHMVAGHGLGLWPRRFDCRLALAEPHIDLIGPRAPAPQPNRAARTGGFARPRNSLAPSAGASQRTRLSARPGRQGGGGAGERGTQQRQTGAAATDRLALPARCRIRKAASAATPRPTGDPRADMCIRGKWPSTAAGALVGALISWITNSTLMEISINSFFAFCERGCRRLHTSRARAPLRRL